MNFFRNIIKHLFVCSLMVFLLFILFLPTKTEAVDYPRLANYFLKWELSASDMAELYKWDVVVLDMEVQYRHPDFLKKLRQHNPNIKLLVYITPESVIQGASSSYSQMRRKLSAGISESWYLKSSQGTRLGWWPGTYVLNVSNDAPRSQGQKWNDYLVNFVVKDLLATGFWDGVYYDNAWDNITWFVGTNVDYNLDGNIDVNLDYKWQEGMKYIYNETRRLSGPNYIIVGNSDSKYYTSELNGMMLENFSASRWQHYMERYEYNVNNRVKPNLNLINANTNNNGAENNYKEMRFGLTSALLEDGYFSFDFGDTNHGQTWWYDEYDVNLGEPLSDSISNNNYNEYKPDVWKRDFANGLAIVNSTNQTKTVDLGGEYEKIHGIQDTSVNDGSIITETTINGYDGLLLLKTFSSLQDVAFTNGDFVRFFDGQGDRIRNGFFVYESDYAGGDKIVHVDLDGNGKRDLLVVHKNRIMAWRDDGMIYMKVYPYTASYNGDLKVAVGDLNKDNRMEVYVFPEVGFPYPVKIYTRHGRQMKADWYPFGTDYTGGYSVAVLDNTASRVAGNSLVISKNTGEPLVSIFDNNYNLAYQWLAFSKNTKIGVNVTTGDLDGDKKDEVIIGAGDGYGPVIKTFDQAGKQLSEFNAYTALNKPGIQVLATDVDYDGRDDIIGMSSGF